ncbi:bifunctional (p)ppGpp synthetase/guanosine-3',5'-bis(diphosphate) 3'-pyrophosphohydrolase (plasmid) [Pontibacillus sp. ALD_SL1]|uniref:HD domain-containing protein n=1 Tax=Pontibacillus sp. ALD_SL1 TaxID=2777185 RepID=UPI001A976BCA|nr:HD domain-containing protein [Pontibacillus sp. ALD_SL1]QST02851.1 bifunctional (p)ppGpp synthetase/guanosine-3',5'-bis(diphosphate) 3'-pyrophosphohydrolase [Pontibacillus sp. ALD_SL1]
MKRTEEARRFAEKAHRGQVRKVNGEPMFTHPAEVATILQEAGFSEDVVIAGYLHDTVEDTEVTFDEIRTRFGERVVQLVKANTEDKTLSWEERKSETMKKIKGAPMDEKALIVADKLSNLRDLKKNEDETGSELWTQFKRGKHQQEWYFRGIAEGMFCNLDGETFPHFFFTYENLVEDTFRF